MRYIFIALLFLVSPIFANAQTPTLLYENSINEGYSVRTVYSNTAMTNALKGKYITSFTVSMKASGALTSFFGLMRINGSNVELINGYQIPTTPAEYNLTFSAPIFLPDDGSVPSFLVGSSGGGNILVLGQNFNQGNMNIKVYGYAPQQPSLGGAYSFINFDDITPSDLIASVKDGTQQTTQKTLPLTVLVGIPLAFLILLAVVNFLQQTVSEEKTIKRRGKKDIINPKGEDFIHHSAKDLEFKREYGKKHL